MLSSISTASCASRSAESSSPARASRCARTHRQIACGSTSSSSASFSAILVSSSASSSRPCPLTARASSAATSGRRYFSPMPESFSKSIRRSRSAASGSPASISTRLEWSDVTGLITFGPSSSRMRRAWAISSRASTKTPCIARRRRAVAKAIRILRCEPSFKPGVAGETCVVNRSAHRVDLFAPAENGPVDEVQETPSLRELGVCFEAFELWDQALQLPDDLGAPALEIVDHVVAGHEPRQHGVGKKADLLPLICPLHGLVEEQLAPRELADLHHRLAKTRELLQTTPVILGEEVRRTAKQVSCRGHVSTAECSSSR